MKTRVDLRLVAEARTFSFAFTCKDCAAFEPETLSCAYGFPTSPHRTMALEVGADIVFCKAFELQ